MPMDPKMLAGMLGGAAGAPDSAPTGDESPDPIQSAFDAIRAAVDEAEKSIVTSRKGDDDTESGDKCSKCGCSCPCSCGCDCCSGSA